MTRRAQNLRPTVVNAILREVRALETEGHKPVSLMRGQPDLPTPEHIVEAACRALRAGRNAYPNNQGEPALRRAVAEKLQRDGLDYDPATEILITDGATLGVAAVLLALVQEGDGVLLPEPVYDAYQGPIALAGAEVQPVPAVIQNNRFTLSRAALEEACRPNTKLLLLNTPWNPVGTVFTKEELNDIADFVTKHNLLLVSDEIYESLVYDNRRHVSPAALGPEIRNRTVLVNSLSKTYAMTGWRVGYCAAPAELIGPLYLVLQQSSRGPAVFVQDAAEAALRGSQDCVAEMRNIYAQRRQQVLEALQGVRYVSVLAPEGGFFAMVDVRALGRPSDEIRKSLLREAGVVVVHGSAYGPAAEGMLRVSFASGGENLAEGLRRLRDGLAQLASRSP
jgi:aspartate aminotransferase